MDKYALGKKIKEAEEFTDEEKSELLRLLRTHKRYGLVWEEKTEDVEERLRDELPVLREVRERALVCDDADAPNHILIEGDNLEALTTLAYTHAGKIDVIYIDPPYNTGNKDFVYNDRYVDSEDSYRHSKWLSFMHRRLKLAKQLLSEGGVIFISIDDHEQAQLNLLCADVFGENFVDVMIWRKSGTGRDGKMKNVKTFRKDHEYIITCFKSYLSLNKSIEKPNWVNAYGNPDNDPRGSYKAGSISRKEEASNPNHKNYYTVVSPSGKTFTRQFDVSKEEFLSLDKDNRIYWGKKRDAVPAIKIFQNEKREVTTSSYILESEFSEIIGVIDSPDSTTTKGSKELESIIDKKGIGEKIRPKPSSLLSKLIQIASNKNSNILDFFAGSGTTMHATMQLNAEDGGRRQCILVTNNENNICEEVTYERNKRVIEGYTTPNGEAVEGLKGNNLRYYKTEFVSRDRTARNMRRLTSLATDMLCIKEDLYAEQPSFGKHKTRQGTFRHFTGRERSMLVVYREEAIEELVDELRGMQPATPVCVYVFSPSEDPWRGMFEDVMEKVELCPLPQAIYNAYRRILPKRRDAVDCVKPQEATTAVSEEQQTP